MRIIIIIAFFFLFASAMAQRDPHAFLARIPTLPDKACSMSDEEKNKYSDKIDRLQNDLRDEIRLRNKEAKSNAKDTEEQVKQNMAKQYGLTQEDMEKMKNKKNMTEAERKELMAKMMKGAKTPDQKKSKNMVELANEQKMLLDKISEINKKFSNKLQELDKTDEDATKDLNAKVEPLRKELSTINDGEGATDADAIHRNNVLHKMQAAEEEYCNKMTPLYYNLLEERLPVLKSSLPDYKRLQEVNSEINKNTTGIEKDIAAPGLMELEAIEEYVKLLNSVFKYRHY